MRHLAEGRKLLLEQLYVLAQDEITARANLGHCRVHLRFDLLILGYQIHELYFPIVHICLNAVSY
jgi:hypothetical protein